jgi:hypothetical protein
MDPVVTPLVIGALAQGVGGLISSKMGSDAARDAARAQANAARQSLDFQKGVYNKASEGFQPYIQAGQEIGLPGYTKAVQEFTQPTYNFTPKDFSLSNWKDPGYDFRIGEAERAINAAMGSKGMTLGSGALKSLQTRGQDMASQEFQNSYQRYLADQARQQTLGNEDYARAMGFQTQNLGNYGNLMGVGRQSVANLAGVGGTQGEQIALSNAAIGDANAQGILGQSNQWQTLVNNLGKGVGDITKEFYTLSQGQK